MNQKSSIKLLYWLGGILVFVVVVSAVILVVGTLVSYRGRPAATVPAPTMPANFYIPATRDPMIDAIVANQNQQATVQADQAQILAGMATQLANKPAQVPAATQPAIAATATSAKVEGQADVRAQVASFKTGSWDITTYEGVTDQMNGWAKNLKDPVMDWSKFPNVDFPKYGFKAADGVEYGMAESAFCQQDQTCDINVPAMHYRLITGDYAINSVDECKKASETDPGCGIILVNVGNVTAMFRDQHVDYGFTVEGRYWNGDAMSTTLWALSSNTVYNMLNGEGHVNMGANCSVPGGCPSVRLTIVIMSGNQILMKATITVTK